MIQHFSQASLLVTKLGLSVQPRNQAAIKPVENTDVSQTEEGTPHENQHEDHADCVF